MVVVTFTIDLSRLLIFVVVFFDPFFIVEVTPPPESKEYPGVRPFRNLWRLARLVVFVFFECRIYNSTLP
jgi:hypothetical protein